MPIGAIIGIVFVVYIFINFLVAINLDVGYLSIGNDEDIKDDKDNKDEE